MSSHNSWDREKCTVCEKYIGLNDEYDIIIQYPHTFHRIDTSTLYAAMYGGKWQLHEDIGCTQIHKDLMSASELKSFKSLMTGDQSMQVTNKPLNCPINVLFIHLLCPSARKQQNIKETSKSTNIRKTYTTYSLQLLIFIFATWAEAWADHFICVICRSRSILSTTLYQLQSYSGKFVWTNYDCCLCSSLQLLY